MKLTRRQRKHGLKREAAYQKAPSGMHVGVDPAHGESVTVVHVEPPAALRKPVAVPEAPLLAMRPKRPTLPLLAILAMIAMAERVTAHRVRQNRGTDE